MKEKKIPMRRCVGCMESKPKKELIRLVNTDEGPVLDIVGKTQGRGVYPGKNRACFATARKKRSIGRSLGITVPEEGLDELFVELSAYEEKQG